MEENVDEKRLQFSDSSKALLYTECFSAEAMLEM